MQLKFLITVIFGDHIHGVPITIKDNYATRGMRKTLEYADMINKAAGAFKASRRI